MLPREDSESAHARRGTVRAGPAPLATTRQDATRPRTGSRAALPRHGTRPTNAAAEDARAGSRGVAAPWRVRCPSASGGRASGAQSGHHARDQALPAPRGVLVQHVGLGGLVDLLAQDRRPRGPGGLVALGDRLAQALHQGPDLGSTRLVAHAALLVLADGLARLFAVSHGVVSFAIGENVRQACDFSASTRRAVSLKPMSCSRMREKWASACSRRPACWASAPIS